PPDGFPECDLPMSASEAFAGGSSRPRELWWDRPKRTSALPSLTHQISPSVLFFSKRCIAGRRFMSTASNCFTDSSDFGAETGT
ncbi:hypothetical protein IRJ41_021009, partial [Triplophysa rosa]